MIAANGRERQIEAMNDNCAQPTKSGSERVAEAALGLDIIIERMDRSTRTARDAADAVGCTVAQIVKALVFDLDGAVVLLLVSGRHDADPDAIFHRIGPLLTRCDPRRVREETGFAIGGVVPIGHLTKLPVYMDATLFEHAVGWCAAGRPDAVFSVAPDAPDALARATGATVVEVAR